MANQSKINLYDHVARCLHPTKLMVLSGIYYIIWRDGGTLLSELRIFGGQIYHQKVQRILSEGKQASILILSVLEDELHRIIDF